MQPIYDWSCCKWTTSSQMPWRPCGRGRANVRRTEHCGANITPSNKLLETLPQFIILYNHYQSGNMGPGKEVKKKNKRYIQDIKMHIVCPRSLVPYKIEQESKQWFSLFIFFFLTKIAYSLTCFFIFDFFTT